LFEIAGDLKMAWVCCIFGHFKWTTQFNVMGVRERLGLELKARGLSNKVPRDSLSSCFLEREIHVEQPWVI